MNLQRIENDLIEISKYTSKGNGINRLAYTNEERGALEFINKLLIKEGLETKIDSCGNLIARREGLDTSLPAVACGSHIDSVYDGGKFDGTIGVLAGLEVIRSLNEKNIKTLHPIELIVFACEESSRFGVSTIGSKAMVGNLDVNLISDLKDKNGVTIQQAFKNCNLDFNSICNSKREKEEIEAFLELHIEQGPYLEENNVPIGIITGIAAPTRLRIRIKGVASHSGSTSMLKRKDALLGAAEISLLVEKEAKLESYRDTVGTVGTLNILPGAMNVVPGYAEMQVDIRGIYKDSIGKILNNLINGIKEVEKNRKLDITWEIISSEDPALTDNTIQEMLVNNCKVLGLDYKIMYSGAGHDAMNMAKTYPTGMIFIPSKNGLSHNPNEFTCIDDIGKGTILLEKTLVDLAISIDS